MSEVDHRTIIARLSDQERALLTRRSDGPGLRQAGLHLGAIAACALYIGLQAPFWPVVVPMQGVLIVFLFCALHEAVHNTPFRADRLNAALARIAGTLVLVPPLWFRYFHFAHHRHTNDPEHDPELTAPKPRTLPHYLVHLSGLPTWRSNAAKLVSNACGRDPGAYVPVRARAKVVAEARWMLAFYAGLAALSIAAGSAFLVWAWVVPALVGQPFLRAYLLAEHARCPTVANMLHNSRTTFTNRLMRRLAWNMPFHAEHHAFPAVPFHLLPRFHAHTREHLKVTARGYHRFHAGFVATLQ